MINFNGLHIEPTTICTLKCPRCARTMFIDKFGQKKFKNHNLNLNHLIEFLNNIDLTNKKITLCGNYGDPIYYPDLENLIKFFKNQGSFIQLVTNGSYKSQQWWENICSLLTPEDTIIFSIDGSPDNFDLYRINANWPSIEIGLEIVGNSKVNSVWKYIPFSFNETNIEQTEIISKNLGIKTFQVEPSDRWEGISDPLKPVNFFGIREDSMNRFKSENKTNLIDPKCKTGFEHYISADGKYLPCCYSHDWRFYYKSNLYKEKNFLISKTTLLEVLQKFEDFYNSIETVKPDYCVFNCSKI